MLCGDYLKAENAIQIQHKQTPPYASDSNLQGIKTLTPTPSVRAWGKKCLLYHQHPRNVRDPGTCTKLVVVLATKVQGRGNP